MISYLKRCIHFLVSKVVAASNNLRVFIFNLFLPDRPVSREFGLDRGTPIDRYYIQKFLEKNRKLIKGNLLEINDNEYSRKYSSEGSKFNILSYDEKEGNDYIIGDLTNFKSLPEGTIDCFICTQTLNFIYDFHTAIAGIKYILAEKGVALVTVASICKISKYDEERWGDFWRFNPQGILKSFEDVFGKENVKIQTFGNYKASVSFLTGLSMEDVEIRDIDFLDPEYPLLIGLIATK